MSVKREWDAGHPRPVGSALSPPSKGFLAITLLPANPIVHHAVPALHRVAGVAFDGLIDAVPSGWSLFRGGLVQYSYARNCLSRVRSRNRLTGGAGRFYKNLVMAGGFLYVVAYGAGRFSMDGSAA